LAATYKANLERAQTAVSKGDEDEPRAMSAMSSIGKNSRADAKSKMSGTHPDSSIPAYTPLVPEQWLDRCHELSHYHLMKYPRIFQSLAYLLKFKSREEICEFDT